MGSALILIFEFCPSDLAQLLRCSEEPLEEAAVKGWFIQLLRGIAACHSAGIMHRVSLSALVFLLEVLSDISSKVSWLRMRSCAVSVMTYWLAPSVLTTIIESHLLGLQVVPFFAFNPAGRPILQTVLARQIYHTFILAVLFLVTYLRTRVMREERADRAEPSWSLAHVLAFFNFDGKKENMNPRSPHVSPLDHIPRGSTGASQYTNRGL